MRSILVEDITERDKEIFRDSCMMCIQSYFDTGSGKWVCAGLKRETDIYAGCCDKWSRLDAINANVLRW